MCVCASLASYVYIIYIYIVPIEQTKCPSPLAGALDIRLCMDSLASQTTYRCVCMCAHMCAYMFCVCV